MKIALLVFLVLLLAAALYVLLCSVFRLSLPALGRRRIHGTCSEKKHTGHAVTRLLAPLIAPLLSPAKERRTLQALAGIGSKLTPAEYYADQILQSCC